MCLRVVNILSSCDVSCQMISRKLFKLKRAMEDPGNLQLCETVRKDVMFSYTCRDGSAGLFSRKDSVRKLF